MSDVVVVSHGVSPEIIGHKSTEFVDADGTNIGELLIGNVDSEGIWVQ